MKEFFDPSEHVETLIPMYGSVHLITILFLILLTLLLLWKKELVKKLVANRLFMIISMAAFLGLEIFYNSLLFIYGIEPYYELIPFNCVLL